MSRKKTSAVKSILLLVQVLLSKRFRKHASWQPWRTPHACNVLERRCYHNLPHDHLLNRVHNALMVGMPAWIFIPDLAS